MNNPRFERNLGFISEAEQDYLNSSTVAIAGAGGDGGMLAIQLARMGVSNFKLADPDPFEIENINRQAACTEKTLGMNKAEAVGEYINSINPDAKVVIFKEGITPENTEEFVHGSSLVIDETEFTMHALGVMLTREARKKSLPVMTALNIGFGAMVTTFTPEGKSLDRVLGFREDHPLDEVAEQTVGLDKWLPFLPKYVDLKVFEKVAKGEKSAPSIAPGVSIAAGIGSTQAFLNLVGKQNRRPTPVTAPKALVIDGMTAQVKEVRFGKASHYRHLGGVLVRNVLKINPQTSY